MTLVIRFKLLCIMLGLLSTTDLLAEQTPTPLFSSPNFSDAQPIGYLPQVGSADNLVSKPESIAAPIELCDYSAACHCDCDPCGGWFDELTLFGGLDGSKQPQDFGANANLGGHVHFNWGVPVSDERGIGLQIGSTIIATDNAVQVYELLGEATTRFQNFTTVGLFQRTASGFAWGFAYDFLNEDSFDDFSLSQWRLRGAYDLGPCDQIGVTVNLGDRSDSGTFNGPTPANVRLRAIDQGSLYWRHWWQTGVQTTSWIGIAEGHSENNAVTGPAPAFDESLLIGADILAPLNNHFALYGETNLIFPADTGTVDAFMGIRFFPGGGARRARRGRFAPLLPVATPTSFSTDLLQ